MFESKMQNGEFCGFFERVKQLSISLQLGENISG